MGPFCSTAMQERQKEMVMYLRDLLSAQAGQTQVATETAYSKVLPSPMPCALWGPGKF